MEKKNERESNNVETRCKVKLSRTKNICLGFEGKLKPLLQTLKVTCKKEQLFICSSRGEVDLLTFSDDWKNLSHQVFFPP